MKRISFAAKKEFVLTFTAPEAGEYNLTLILICDSYLGCDEYEEFKLKVLENPDADDDHDEDKAGKEDEGAVEDEE